MVFENMIRILKIIQESLPKLHSKTPLAGKGGGERKEVSRHQTSRGTSDTLREGNVKIDARCRDLSSVITKGVSAATSWRG